MMSYGPNTLVVIVARIMSPTDVHVWILETYEYVTLYDKGGSEDMIKWKILRWRDYFRLSRQTQYNHRAFIQKM